MDQVEQDRSAHADLPQRLRVETAGLHASVEAALDLPDAVRSRRDYIALLTRLHDLHAPLEQRLAATQWAARWAEVGLDLDRHRRTPLLAADLSALGAPTRPAPAPVPRLTDFPAALGCLYVLEGSALGGRVLAPALRARVGDLPMSFLAGERRPGPAPWPALRAALRRVAAADGDEVVRGARATFAAFGAHVGGFAVRRP